MRYVLREFRTSRSNWFSKIIFFYFDYIFPQLLNIEIRFYVSQDKNLIFDLKLFHQLLIVAWFAILRKKIQTRMSYLGVTVNSMKYSISWKCNTKKRIVCLVTHTAENRMNIGENIKESMDRLKFWGREVGDWLKISSLYFSLNLVEIISISHICVQEYFKTTDELQFEHSCREYECSEKNKFEQFLPFKTARLKKTNRQSHFCRSPK